METEVVPAVGSDTISNERIVKHSIQFWYTAQGVLGQTGHEKVGDIDAAVAKAEPLIVYDVQDVIIGNSCISWRSFTRLRDKQIRDLEVTVAESGVRLLVHSIALFLQPR